MWGGKSARNARYSSGSSSSYSTNRWNKSKSEWTKSEWMEEVADKVSGVHLWGDYKISAKANYDSITVEVWMQIYKESLPYSSIDSDVKQAVRDAIYSTNCPYDVKFNTRIYEK